MQWQTFIWSSIVLPAIDITKKLKKNKMKYGVCNYPVGEKTAGGNRCGLEFWGFKNR